ncbi:galactan beta-1,4-galactosyltransferase GALS2-like isoform X1 [Capsicum annuum]|uniref:galactan beta-1,4-galactosyltransferase GALS2-like isoform X1 n=2 Tax=Capsicum annuum TaxID=4072 RepID=UPI001FB13ACD|nr:galactan beta-1,4-galactosyltransferase GALS2-like isoform X1 [Capsicum annuum]
MFVGDSIWSCYDKMTYLEMWSFSKEEVVDDGRLGLSSFPKRKEASPTTKGGGDSSFNTIDTFEALTETEQDFVNFTFVFEAPLKYDIFYCVTSFYENLIQRRVREWLAFHIRLFGEKSHFVIHDAGGVHDGVMEVLKPWMDKGYVTLQDIREQERFDGSPLCKCQCLTSFVSLRIAVNPTDCRFIGYPPSAMASTTMSHVLDRLQLCIGEKYQD